MRQLVLALAFGMVFLVWASGAQAQRRNFVCAVNEAGTSVTGSTQVRLTDNGGAFTSKLFEAADGLDKEFLAIALSAIALGLRPGENGSFRAQSAVVAVHVHGRAIALASLG